MLAPTPHSKGSCGLKHTPVLLTSQTHGLCADAVTRLAPARYPACRSCLPLLDAELLEICLCLSIPSKHGLPSWGIKHCASGFTFAPQSTFCAGRGGTLPDSPTAAQRHNPKIACCTLYISSIMRQCRNQRKERVVMACVRHGWIAAALAHYSMQVRQSHPSGARRTDNMTQFLLACGDEGQGRSSGRDGSAPWPHRG